MQANREYVFEDPLAPLRLPPLAQISEFWRRYDRLADIHDKKLTANLNGNLDVLLIFAALFSAINTTFISITMPDLSANPSDETNNLLRLLIMRTDNNTLTPSDLIPSFSPSSNSIIVNCLLYASLSCSLLAAVGAMMAKEWLQSFDRTGQTGPLEQQALFRQRKFNGVLEWHLEAVIKFLPNLLLLSVIFFFIGVCLFLFPINTAVAGIVLAFSGIGVVFSGIVIVAGAVAPTCPYQSAASSAVRRGCLGLVGSWRLIKRTPIRALATRASELVQELWASTRQWNRSFLDKATMMVSKVAFWNHPSTAPGDSEVQQTMTQNPTPSSAVLPDSGISTSAFISPLPPSIMEREQAEGRDSLSPTQAQPVVRWLPTRVSQAIERLKRRWVRSPWRGTLSAVHRSPAAAPAGAETEQVLAIQAARWLLETTSNRGDQISTAQFICSLERTTCANVFEDYDSWKRLMNLTLGAFEIWYSQPSRENQEVAELFGLVLCRVIFHSPKGDDKWSDITEEFRQGSSKLGEAFLQVLQVISDKWLPLNSEDDQRCFHLALIHASLKAGIDIKQYRWVELCCLLASPSPVASVLQVVWAQLAGEIGTKWRAPFYRPSLKIAPEEWDNKEKADKTISYTLLYSLEGFQSLQGDRNLELNAAQGYTICLQKARELFQEGSEHNSTVQQGLGDLIWSYIDPLTTSGSTDIRLVRLSVEALLTLKTFLPSHSSSSAILITSDVTLIRLAKLIDTVADVLLDDLTSLPGLDESRERTFNACVIRILIWIWRNHPNRDLHYWEHRELFESSCRLWAPLEKEVHFYKTGSFNDKDKPLTPEDLKTVIEFAIWVRGETLFALVDYDENYIPICLEPSGFIARNADVGINRLYAHFDRRAEWQYHLYDFHESGVSCSRSMDREDRML